MTTFEHAMVGVTGVLALGLHRRFGGRIAALAAVAAVAPDWDGLTILAGMRAFDAGHRAWGHNLLSCIIVGTVLGLVEFRYRLLGKIWEWMGPKLGVRPDEGSVTTESRTVGAAVVWALVGAFAALSHLIGDLVVSGAPGLTDWELPALWPFSQKRFVWSLVSWGDPTITIIFAVGMLVMWRFPHRLQRVAVSTLVAVVVSVAL